MPPRYETKIFRKESDASEVTDEKLLPTVIELEDPGSSVTPDEIAGKVTANPNAIFDPRKQTRNCKILIAVAALFTIFVGCLLFYTQSQMTSPFDDVTIDTTTTIGSPTSTKSENVITTKPREDIPTTSDAVLTTSSKMPSTTEEEVTTTKTMTTTLYKDPILFLPGEYTYHSAVDACKDLSLKLATKADMLEAFQAGYERCQYGWLRNMHSGYVMQESGARPSCSGGAIGVIYSSYKSPDDVVKGAYCSTRVPVNDALLSSDAKPSSNNSVNWWTTLDAADVLNLKSLLAETGNTLTRSMKAIYPCCNYLNVDSLPDKNVSFVWQKMSSSYMETLANIYKEELNLPDLKVYPHLNAQYEAMMVHGAATTNRTKIIADITRRAYEAKVDGVIVDYEPTQQYTKQHAVIYRDFLNALSDEMKIYGMKVGMTVAAWGILKEYELYADSDCEIIGSMSNTYYGHNVDKNINDVRNMLQYISTDRLQIGIGAMHDIRKPKSRDYRWTSHNLMKFVEWLKHNGVTQLYIYPGDWSNIQNVEDYFISALNEFIK